MSHFSVHKMLHESNLSIYKLVLIAAARANELAQGATPLVKCDSKKVSTIALNEIAEGKVRYEDAKGKGKKSKEPKE